MRETVAERVERREREHRQMKAFLRKGPYEPRATVEEVLEVACSNCKAEVGTPCDMTFASIAGMVIRGMRGVHLRRYLDKTHDPR